MLAAVAVREQSGSNHQQQQRQQRQHHRAATAGRAGLSGNSSTPSTADLIDLAAQQQVAALGALVAVLLQAQVKHVPVIYSTVGAVCYAVLSFVDLAVLQAGTLPQAEC
jgi:hypothetical protein